MREFRILKWLKNARKSKVRKKTLMYFFVSAVMINSFSLFTYNSTRLLTQDLNKIFTNDIFLTDLGNTLDSVETSLKDYLTTSHSTSLKTYLDSSNKLKNMTMDFKTTLSNDESELLFIDIKGMTITYLQDTDFAVAEKRGRDISGYTDVFNEASQTFGYINDYINNLKIYEFKENNSKYLRLSGKLEVLQIFNIIAIIVATGVNILLILVFAYSITEPIIRLSRAASDIAHGNYDIPEIKVNTNDEVKTLAVSFQHMAGSIKRQMVEIREKAQIESRLKEQEMQNLKMKSTLNEVELRALQAQIDPHFMFNTLNAAMQIAMFEDAERTQVFLENFSELLRYNLGNMDTPSTVINEISNVESYIYLLNERYGNSINFTKHIDGMLPSVRMPRMTLQPIVENSFIHGINEMQSGGAISVSARCREDMVVVEVADNGCGMNEETIKKVLSGGRDMLAAADTGGKKNHSIGLRNVISRLMLYYHLENQSDVIEIESEVGKGTRVIVKLPLQQREEP